MATISWSVEYAGNRWSEISGVRGRMGASYFEERYCEWVMSVRARSLL